jgi:flagellar motor switch protein FliM
MMNFCIPFNVIEPVINQLSANTWLSYAKKDSRKHNVLSGLGAAPVEVVVHLGETAITARQLMDLRVGDYLPIEKSTRSPLLVEIGGHPKFWVSQHQIQGRKVVKVLRRADPNARANG